jgi:hypothetical protein
MASFQKRNIHGFKDFMWPTSQSLDAIFLSEWNMIGNKKNNNLIHQEEIILPLAAPIKRSWFRNLGRFYHMNGLIQLSSPPQQVKMIMRPFQVMYGIKDRSFGTQVLHVIFCYYEINC